MKIDDITLDSVIVAEYIAAGGTMFDLIESVFLELGENPETAYIKAREILFIK